MQEEIFEVGAEGLAVGQLAEKLAVNPGDVLKTLFLAGIMAHVNQVRLPDSAPPHLGMPGHQAHLTCQPSNASFPAQSQVWH